MGQYYRAVLGCKDAKSNKDLKVFSSFDVQNKDGKDIGSCQKLMEHGWLGNRYCRCIEKQIYKNPMRVAWVGDYAEDSDFEEIKENYGFDYTPSVEDIWGENVETPIQIYEGRFTVNKKFLVNHSFKEYIDIAEYIKRSTDNEGWQVNPLVVLTAIGNGRGGGDYYGPDGIEDVGIWAWSVLSFENKAPEGFSEYSPTFMER